MRIPLKLGLLILSIIWTFVACSEPPKMPNPLPTITAVPNQASGVVNPPPPNPEGEAEDPPQPKAIPLVEVGEEPDNIGVTQIEFLVDNSGSMNDNCGDLGNETGNYLGFLFRFFKQNIRDEYREKFIIGASEFSDTRISVIKPLPISQLPASVEIVNKNQGNTAFIPAISDALGMLNSLPQDASGQNEVTHRYLIILTDGDTVDVDGVVKEIKARLQADDRLSVFLTLWCSGPKPQAWTIWNDPTSTTFRIFEGPEEMSVYLAGMMKNVLEPEVRLRRVGTAPVAEPVAGYNSAISVAYWNIHAADLLDITTNQGTASLRVGDRSTYPLIPFKGCPVQQVAVNTRQSNGLVVFNPQRVQHLEARVQSLSENGLEIINNEPVTLNIEVSDALTKQSLGPWSDCFSVRVMSPDEETGSAGSLICEQAGALSPSNSDRNFMATIQCRPSQPFTDAGQLPFKIQVGLLCSDSSGPVGPICSWESSAQGILVKYKVDYVGASSPSGVVSSLEEVVRREFDFDNVVVQPRVFLLTSLTQEELYAVNRTMTDGSNTCHSVDMEFARRADKFYGYEVGLSDEADHSELSSTSSPAQVHFTQVDTNRFRYTVETYGYHMQDCQFSTLLFDWREAPDKSKLIKWLCTNTHVTTICHIADEIMISPYSIH